MKIQTDTITNFKDQVSEEINRLAVDLINYPPILREMYSYAMSNGRQYRPILILLGNLVSSKSYSQLSVNLAVLVELIHKYSLVVDDFVDKDKLRRSKKTFFAKFGEANTAWMETYFRVLSRRKIISFYTEYVDYPTISEVLNLIDEIEKNMSLGLALELNTDLNNQEEVRKISSMQSSTILRNSLLLGYLAGNGNCKSTDIEYSILYKIGDLIGKVFQDYNDCESLFPVEYRRMNKGDTISDIDKNRKNILRTNQLISSVAGDSESSAEAIRLRFLDIEKDINQIYDLITYFPVDSLFRIYLKSFINEQYQNMKENINKYSLACC